MKLSFITILIFIINASCSRPKKDLPNIIFIMSDDHAYQAISAYGHGLNETPNIDRIASEGALFNMHLLPTQFVLQVEQLC